jgi:TetR/AcrR family acrAB operon transcriptional repressor
MARKTKAEAEQTRRNILDAALELFHRKGYSRTTLGDIARSAGVTRGAIYWHFKDKVELFLALKDDVETSTKTRIEDLLQEEVASLEDVRASHLRFLRNLEENARFCTYFEIVFYRTEFTEELQPLMASYQDKLRRMVRKNEQDFEQLRKRGRVRADLVCRQAAFDMAAIIFGLINFWLMDRSYFSLSQQSAAMLDRYMTLLAPKAGDGCAVDMADSISERESE